FLFCCKTQSELHSGNDVVRKVDKEHRIAPPGTVWIKDSIYMDQCEVRNLDYLEYVRWIKKYDSVNYTKVLPDTMVWIEKNTFNEPMTNIYFWHPAYRNYPVVGVSYEQALDYCKWRTERVKEFIKLKKHSNTIEETFHVKDFHYRLPTKKEWEYAAYAESGSDYGFVSMQAKDNSPNFNVKEAYMLGYNGFGMEVTNPAIYKKPNRFGLYNTIGNVAEMIMDKSVCKGGSWMNSINDCEISDSIRYDKPTAWLGFRCVCVVTK
ncbi:MAG: formylglycine-generating enzyme family protein, partial [Bacteroidia bacterium]